MATRNESISESHTVKADAVHRHRSLFDRNIAATRHFGIHRITEAEVAAAVDILDVVAHYRAVDMSLNDVSVKTAVHEHAALKVHEVAGLPGRRGCCGREFPVWR